jgi:hypothetical protein
MFQTKEYELVWTLAVNRGASSKTAFQLRLMEIRMQQTLLKNEIIGARVDVERDRLGFKRENCVDNGGATGNFNIGEELRQRMALDLYLARTHGLKVFKIINSSQ